MSRRMQVGIMTIVVVLALWFVLTSLTGAISPGRFPSPEDAWDALLQLWSPGYANGTLLEHVSRSLLLIVAGFAAAILIGVPLGLLMGWSRRAEAFINPIFLLIRPIPPLAWIPLAILWLGLGDAAKILVIWFAAFVPSVINAYTGIRTLDKTLIEAARMLGTPHRRMILEVLLPASVPSIIAGLRVSAGLGWQSLVGAELIVASAGVGYMMVQGQASLSTTTVMCGMIAIGLVGIAIDALLRAIEARVLQSRGQSA